MFFIRIIFLFTGDFHVSTAPACTYYGNVLHENTYFHVVWYK
jgi:hypothetical protein